MRFNDRPADRKAQPSATNVVRPSPEKPVEHTKLLPFRNTRPAVTHIDLHRVIIADDFYFNRRIWRRVLQRILDEVDEDLFQKHFVDRCQWNVGSKSRLNLSISELSFKTMERCTYDLLDRALL